MCMRKGSPKAVAERKKDGKKKRGGGGNGPHLNFQLSASEHLSGVVIQMTSWSKCFV